MHTWNVHKENAKRTMILLTIKEVCSNPGFPQEVRKNYPAQGNLMPIYLHGPSIWKVMPRNEWNAVASPANKTTLVLYKVSTPCLDDHTFKEEELGSVGELSTVCS